MEQSYQKLTQSLLKILPERHQEVLERRYGMDGDAETLEAIGEDFGVTRERVRQIEKAAFDQLRESDEIGAAQDTFKYLGKHLADHGEHRREARLLDDFGGAKNGSTLLFLLDLGDAFGRRNETEEHHSLWTVNHDRLQDLDGFVDAVSDHLADIGRPLEESKFWKEVERIARRERLVLTRRALASWLDIAKLIRQNRFNEWGLVEWSEIVPKSVGDKAYIVLRREEEPLHFDTIVEKMNKVYFMPHDASPFGVRFSRPAHVQTVHNELIKDDRFVLVGRGMYALREWGYEPGTVKDVLVGILKETGQPMSVPKIMAQVARARIVKSNTVLLNLQNKKFFVRTSRGEYALRKA